MNIKELQLEKAKSEAIISSIRKGREPILSQINAYIKSKFKFAPAGSPSFRPIIGKKYDCSNSAEYNRMLSQIQSDLTDLFDADKYINNEILSTCNYYESEKTRLTGLLNQLQNELSNVMTIIEMPEISSDISDTFDNFNNTEFNGDQERNIPKATSHIDLRSKYASNDTIFVNKINLSKATVLCEVLTSNIKNEQLSDIKHCISDNVNETWVQKVTTATNDKLNYNVGVTLSEEAEVNTITYIASSPRKQSITLKLIDKDGNTFTYNTITTSEKAEWNFKNISIVGMIFGVEKQECDATNGVEFEYYIGAKNIGLYNNTYVEKSTFVSTGFPINNPFSQIVFAAKEDVPASTNITYYVGIDNGIDSVSWMQVKNKEVTELNLLPLKRIVIEPNASALKSIAALDESPIHKTVRLHVGVDMWSVRTCEYSEQVLPKDIFAMPISEFKEMNYIKYPISKKTASIYTCYADFDSPSVITGNFIGGITHSIYVNGAKITGQTTKDGNTYKLRMAKGTNQIQVLVINNSNEDKNFKFDAYVQEHSTMVRAIKQAKETDDYEINYALHADTFDKFTVNESSVVVNYDTNKYGIRYVVDYRYNDKPELFENANLRVMATLLSKNHNVTPKLFSYQAAIL